jgi:hypothetical protein
MNSIALMAFEAMGLSSFRVYQSLPLHCLLALKPISCKMSFQKRIG